MDEAKYKEQSKARLKSLVDKKIDTTMIGALSAFEENVFKSDFFNGLDYDDKLELKNCFEKARSKILDIGNNSKRILDEEFDLYTIEWNRYQMVMKVKSRNYNE